MICTLGCAVSPQWDQEVGRQVAHKHQCQEDKDYSLLKENQAASAHNETEYVPMFQDPPI